MEHPDFTPAASCVPCHVVYTNVRSGEEQSARRINYKSDTVDNLPCSILQRAAPKQKIMRWGGIGPSRACGLGYSLERLVAIAPELYRTAQRGWIPLRINMLKNNKHF